MGELMLVLGYNILMALKVLMAFILIYIFLPAKITDFEPEANGLLDKIFISLTNSTLVVIIVTYILAFIRLNETVSLLFLCMAAYLAGQWIKGYPPSVVIGFWKRKYLAALFDWADRPSNMKMALARLQKIFSACGNRFYISLKRYSAKPFEGIMPIAALIGAAWIRYHYSLIHAAYSASDPYIHLIWAKDLGSNRLYADGIYPYGFHAVINGISKLTLMDPYWIIRFLGPLTGFFIVMSVYYFSLRTTRSRLGGLLALVIYGLVSDGRFPSAVYRQTAALPMEFAAIFVLPGLYFLWLYLHCQKRTFMLLYLETVAITVLIHPYATVYLILWAIILGVIACLFKKVTIKTFVEVGLFTAISAGLALLPFGIGLMMGKVFYKGATDFILANINGAVLSGSSGLLIQVSQNLFLNLSLLLGLVLLAIGVLRRKRQNPVLIFCVGIISLLMLLMFQAPQFGFPQIINQLRTGVFASLMFAVVYAWGFSVVEGIIPDWQVWGWHINKRRLFEIIVSVLCLIVIFRYTPDIPQMRRVEYDAAASGYLTIAQQFPRLDWTLVAPTEQLQEASGNGWHYDLLKFVRTFNLKQAADPGFTVPIPTNHIFFFIERKPFGAGRLTDDADAAKELAPMGNDPYSQYYIDVGQRTILEAKAYKWMKTYLQHHAGVSVFYEDSNLIIYHISKQQAAGK